MECGIFYWASNWLGFGVPYLSILTYTMGLGTLEVFMFFMIVSFWGLTGNCLEVELIVVWVAITATYPLTSENMSSELIDLNLPKFYQKYQASPSHNFPTMISKKTRKKETVTEKIWLNWRESRFYLYFCN